MILEEFGKSSELYFSKYKHETEQLISNTQLIYEPDKFIYEHDTSKRFYITNTSIIDEAYRYSNCVVHNFSSSCKVAENLLENRACFESELCCSSNLFESICFGKDIGINYYGYNRQFGNRGSNRIIYSPDVLFHVNGDIKLLSVLSCSAPKYNSLRHDELVFRIKCLFHAVKLLGFDMLITGAWGCGEAHNNVNSIISAWKEALSTLRLCDVLFAIPDSRLYNCFWQELSNFG